MLKNKRALAALKMGESNFPEAFTPKPPLKAKGMQAHAGVGLRSRFGVLCNELKIGLIKLEVAFVFLDLGVG